MKRYKNNKQRRETRTRFSLSKNLPRLSVFRSNKYIYAQIIDDKEGKTLLSASIKDVENKNKEINKIEASHLIGKFLGEKAVKKGIKTVVFDRGANRYHGRVKALAESAREAGLEF